MMRHRRIPLPISALCVLMACLVSVLPARGAQGELQKPPRPWAEVEAKDLPPGEPGEDYTPVVTPNGRSADYRVVDGVKVYHLVAEPVTLDIVPGKLQIKTWGYNGDVPGPTIEACVGDRVRIYVTNNLPAPTSVHWHGILLECGMDGVMGLTQPKIEPGETFKYEFTVPESGTFMYHPHFDSMTQEGMGLTGMFIVHERQPEEERPDRDFAIMLHEWSVEGGTMRPNTLENVDFNLLTMNGTVMPATEPLVTGLGDDVRIRFGNLSAMDHHPIHLHGYEFKVIGSSGGWLDPQHALPVTTVLVPVGTTRVIQFNADNPGDWLMHCHMTHHTMNQMGHGLPNMVGAETNGVDKKIRELVPGYMSMGTLGMRDMTRMGMPLPDNSIPMLGAKLQFGQTVLGGMATVLKVREGLESYKDPGWYDFPEGTMSREATETDMERDGIQPPPMPEKTRRLLDNHNMSENGSGNGQQQ